MKFKCPSCSAPFDSLELPVFEVHCPSCGHRFMPDGDAWDDADLAMPGKLAELLHPGKSNAILRTALSDLYVLGCWLISTGKMDAGMKACDAALCALPGMSNDLYGWLIRGARGTPVQFGARLQG